MLSRILVGVSLLLIVHCELCADQLVISEFQTLYEVLPNRESIAVQQNRELARKLARECSR